MLYLHDVWVNWFEGEENEYNVFDVFEWRKNDDIQLIQQTPIMYITEAFYKYIANDLQELPELFLEKIKNKTSIQNHLKRETLTYSCIVTDGINVLAIDTIGYRLPIRKSKLMPRQEYIVQEKIQKHKLPLATYPIQLSKKCYHILSLHPRYMIGLTRREKRLKQLLMIILDQLIGCATIDELRYWLTEWSPEEYQTVLRLPRKRLEEKLYYRLRVGWGMEHECFLNKLVHYHKFLKPLLDEESIGRNILK